MQTITATDSVRHTRKNLHSVAGRGETVIVERNNVQIARITPSRVTSDLAGLRLLTPGMPGSN